MNDEPWSEQDKCFLLGEILKTSLSSQALMALISQQQIQPNWLEVIPPKGRNLRSCQEMFSHLAGSPQTFHAPAPLQPYSRPPPELHRKRAFHHGETSSIGGRMIAPKPTTFQPDPTAGSAYTMTPIGEPPLKKKRGRPTKAELEARQMSALGGQPQPSPYAPQVPHQQPAPSPSPFAMQVDPPVGAPSSAGSMPAGARMTTPAPSSTVDATSETSASKRRRGRPSKADVEEQRVREEGRVDFREYGSPPAPETGPPSASTRLAASMEGRGENIQDRMRVEKFMGE